jgi:hypothetical protein
MIQDIGSKIKGFVGSLTTGELFLVLTIVAVAFGAFALGRLSVEETREPVRIEYPAASAQTEAAGVVLGTSATDVKAYVASKTGAKYHLPWCAGAQAIKEENKLWFATKEEAEAAGYQPAGNCKGI